MERKEILIIEDDVYINTMLQELLTTNGYKATSAFSGTEALMCIERQKFDLILLDLMLPGKSGQSVLEEIKPKSIPIIAVSAIDNTETKIELLQAGADDYITKPFDNRELLARIDVQLRRKTNTNKAQIMYKDMVMNIDTYEVLVNNIAVNLTKREFMILKLLMENPNKVFTKANLYQAVWEDDFLGDENTINVHMSNLRTKLHKANPSVEYIQTVWGIGFKMHVSS